MRHSLFEIDSGSVAHHPTHQTVSAPAAVLTLFTPCARDALSCLWISTLARSLLPPSAQSFLHLHASARAESTIDGSWSHFSTWLFANPTPINVIQHPMNQILVSRAFASRFQAYARMFHRICGCCDCDPLSRGLLTDLSHKVTLDNLAPLIASFLSVCGVRLDFSHQHRSRIMTGIESESITPFLSTSFFLPSFLPSFLLPYLPFFLSSSFLPFFLSSFLLFSFLSFLLFLYFTFISFLFLFPSSLLSFSF